MKNIILWFACLLSITACHRKSVPSKTTNATVITNPTTTKKVNPPPNTSAAEPKPDSAMYTAPAAPAPSAMIVVDGYGKILTPSSKLPPDTSVNADYTKLSRGFTPQELANLRARYKTVPPRVLYVPDQYTLKSMRGTYCIYKKKFWYWKKDDGLFYLDEMYYK